MGDDHWQDFCITYTLQPAAYSSGARWRCEAEAKEKKWPVIWSSGLVCVCVCVCIHKIEWNSNDILLFRHISKCIMQEIMCASLYMYYFASNLASTACCGVCVMSMCLAAYTWKQNLYFVHILRMWWKSVQHYIYVLWWSMVHSTHTQQ